jgi:hypothetical protein
MSINALFDCNYSDDVDDFKGYLICAEKDGYNEDCPKIVCALDVPAFLIPKEIITFFESYAVSIETFKILKCPHDEEQHGDMENTGYGDVKYNVLLHMSSSGQASKLISEFNGQPYSTLDQSTICKLVFVTHISYFESSSSYLLGLDSKYDKLSLAHKTAEGLGSRQPFLYRRRPTNMNSSQAAVADVENYSQEKEKVDGDDHCSSNDGDSSEDVICAVCLESLRDGSGGMVKFVMYCGHCFHAACVARLESPQCPVCR